MALLKRLGSIVNGKQFYGFSIPEQRILFREIQPPASENPAVSVSRNRIKMTYGEVETYLYKPRGAEGNLPFVYCVHDGGWIFGTAADYEHFVFDLVMRSGMAVVFPKYTLAPEAKFPAQQEQCIEVLDYLLKHGKEFGLQAEKIALVSDSVGCQLASARCVLNRERDLRLPIVRNIMLHLFINCTADFGNSVKMNNQWTEQFFGAYFSTIGERSNFMASPAFMTPEQAKKYMPPTTVILSDNDGLRNQSKGFAKLLQTSGVPCGIVEAGFSLHVVEVFKGPRDSPTAALIMGMISANLIETLRKEQSQ